MIAMPGALLYYPQTAMKQMAFSVLVHIHGYVYGHAHEHDPGPGPAPCCRL